MPSAFLRGAWIHGQTLSRGMPYGHHAGRREGVRLAATICVVLLRSLAGHGACGTLDDLAERQPCRRAAPQVIEHLAGARMGRRGRRAGGLRRRRLGQTRQPAARCRWSRGCSQGPGYTVGPSDEGDRCCSIIGALSCEPFRQPKPAPRRSTLVSENLTAPTTSTGGRASLSSCSARCLGGCREAQAVSDSIWPGVHGGKSWG